MTAPLSFLARLMLVAIFLASAIGEHIPNFNGVTASMQAEGIPNAQMMHAGAVGFMLLGSVLVLLGFWARLGAALLAVFLVLTMYYIHDFWTFADAAEKQQQMIHFMKNLSMLGAMTFIVANGAGTGSVDRRRVVIKV